MSYIVQCVGVGEAALPSYAPISALSSSPTCAQMLVSGFGECFRGWKGYGKREAAPLSLSAAKKHAKPISISFHREMGMEIFASRSIAYAIDINNHLIGTAAHFSGGRIVKRVIRPVPIDKLSFHD
jgi:hypothetical protein